MHTIRCVESMRSERYIRILEPRVSEDRKILFELTCSKGIEKYFWSNRLYIEYEKSIERLDHSILYIPAVSSVITVAWAIGAEVYVEKLDQAYLRSLSEIKPVMKRWYPDFSFSTEIDVENLVSNRFCNDRYGLLFTGGVDSVTSYIKHERKKPDLIKVWGQDVPFDDEKNWKKVQKMLTEFSDRNGAKIHVIRTNIPRIANKQVLYREFGLDWWPNVCHGIVLTGLSAPLTCVTGIGTLYVASGGTKVVDKIPWGSSPLIDNKITWAGVKVVHDDYEVSRQQKIRCFLRDYLKDKPHIFLKVCNDSRLPSSNCGRCEKCLRTITELLIEGIDPNKCGFQNIDSKTLDFIKKSFIKKNFFARKWIIERRAELYARIAEFFFWKDAQDHMLNTPENSLQWSKEFLDWFRTFNISEYLQIVQENVRISLPYLFYMVILTICYRMPGSTQNAIKQLLNFLLKLPKESV
jgi:hypothetical protein